MRTTKKKTAAKKTKRTTKKVSRPRTKVTIIIDASSSMAPLRHEVVSGFNNQIETLKKTAKEQDVTVSLVTFANIVYAPTVWNQPIESLHKWELANYNPNGNTALYDAVGTTLQRLCNEEKESDSDTAYLMVIMTDGEENYSRTYSSPMLATLVKALQNSGRWTFTYMGANQDLSKVSETLNIPIGNTMTFVPSSFGTMGAFNANNASVANYMVSRSAGNMASTQMYSNTGTSAQAPEATLTTAEDQMKAFKEAVKKKAGTK